MSTFEAVLYPEGSRLTPALRLGEKGKKLALETVYGKRVTLAVNKLVYREPLAAASRSEAVEALRRLLARAEEEAAEVDPELLWESVVDGGDGGTALADLARLYFGASDLVHIKALDLALGEGGAFFGRSGAVVRPISRAARARDEQREAAVAAETEWLEVTAARMREALAAGNAPATLAADSDVGDAAAAVRRFVCDGDPRGRELVERLVDAVATPPGASRREMGLQLLLDFGCITRPSDLFTDRYTLVREFTPRHLRALDEVRGALAAVGAAAQIEVEAYTIDDEGSTDRDDAFSLRTGAGGIELGGIELGVHIADPSPYVPPGSVLDEEAYTRGTTVYLPDRTYPMFPRELSHDLASLTAGVSRPVLSFYFHFRDAAAEPGPPRLAKERLTVRANLNYDDVDRSLRADTPPPPEVEMIARAVEIAAHCRARREARGAIVFHKPELRVRVDQAGEVQVKVLDRASPARNLVSELMILVNESGARFLRERGIPAIYRAQHPPREPLDLSADYDPIAFRREVRKLSKARLTLDPEPHAGLGLDCYTQLSSPLRRYADLVLHRQLSHALAGEIPPFEDRDALLEVVVTSDMNYQTAVDTERKATRAWLLRWFESRLGETFAVTVIEADEGRGRLRAELDGYGVEARLEVGPGEAPPLATRLRARLRAVDVLDEDLILETSA